MAKIIGMGRVFPSQVRKNSDWSEDLIKAFQDHAKRDLLDVTDKGTHKDIDQFTLDCILKEKSDPFLGGIERRVVSSDADLSYELGIEAAKIAVSGFNSDDIGVVFAYESIPDRLGTSASPVIANRLGIKNAFALQTDNACASQLVQMQIAKTMVDSGAVKSALLVVSNVMTKGLPL